MSSLFDNEVLARQALEALRWPQGPQCTHCDASGTDVLLIGGEKQSHRNGLYHCKKCRKQFTVTMGTAFERSRIALSTWMRAAYAFSAEPPRQHGMKTTDTLRSLSELGSEIGVTYKTILRMRNIIKRAAKGYKGHLTGFGAWPRSFMKSRAPRRRNYRTTKASLLAAGKHPSLHTIDATGILLHYVPTKGFPKAALERAECLLKLLLRTAPMPTKKRTRRQMQLTKLTPRSDGTSVRFRAMADRADHH